MDFRLLFARSADALLILDTGTNRFIDFNLATQAMLRCPNRKELLSLHPAELSPPFQPDGRASHEKAEAMIALAMRQGSHRFEWTHCSAYRADFPVEVLLTPLLMKKRQLFLVTWRDITERKQAEQALTFAHRRASVLAQLGRELAEAATPRTAALSIFEAARQLVGWDSCWLQLWNEEKQVFEYSVNFDLIDRERREVPSNPASLRAPGRAVRRAMQEGAYLHLRADATDSIAGEHLFGAPHRSLSRMFVPLRRDGRLLGVLSIQSYQRNAYEPVALELLQALADHCAGTLARIQTRAALDAIEARYRRVVENISDAVMVDDTASRVVYANQRFLDLFGLIQEDLPGLHLEDYVAPEFRAALRERHSRRVAGEDVPDCFEYQGLVKGGARCWLEVRVTKVVENGVVVGTQSAIRDITERKAAEARIRQQTEVLDRAPVAVVINDLAHRNIYWNRGAEHIFGWTATQALGRTAEELAAPETLAMLIPGRAAALEHGEWRGEVPFPTTLSGRRIVELVMSLIRDEAGQPQARLTIGVDVTEKKILEKKFLQVQRLENIGLLAAGIAHDLNNVLAPIIMATPLLRSHVKEPSGFKILELLEKSADRGTGLIRQILSFAHDSSGERTLVQLKHLLRDVSSLIQETFPKSIKFETEIPNELWTVRGNPTHLHQVILNLCVNARDAMPQGGTLRLVAANRQLDGYEASTQGKACAGAHVALEVTDTGAGIAPDLLPRIWEPFFTTKGEHGTGLGLSTVNGIVHAHGGFINVESQVGCGSLFRVLLPAAEVEADPAAGGKAYAPSRRGQGELVLVVEDEINIRDLVATSLSQHGYRVLAASNGTEAYTLFISSAEEIKLVLTDLNMPELDGIGLVRDLLKLRPTARILFMSGAGSRPQSELGERLPVNAPFLRKPFTVEALLKLVYETLAAPETVGDR